MPLIVQKYGGTSVGDAARIKNVARRLLETQREGNRVLGVISAMVGVTDNLLKLSREMSSDPTDRELDILLSTGERAASALTAMAINALGGKAIVVVHQPPSDTTTAFVARAGDRRLTFAAAKPDASTITDRETGSQWTPYGACVGGPLKGAKLEAIVLEPEYWFAWVEFHRDTAIYEAPEHK